MSANNENLLGGLTWAGAAIIALATLGPARAEGPTGAPAVEPAPILAAAAATSAAGMVVVPVVRQGVAPAAVHTGPAPTGSAACVPEPQWTRFEFPLRRTAQRLASGKPLTIVAIGSSSTAGAGASSPAASYPSQLAVELRKRFPGEDIVVLNRGRNGEETADMMARFSVGVIAEHPQLVLWQVGTNSVLRDRSLTEHAVQLREGLEELKATGADIILIDPQYSPKVLAKPEIKAMLEQIAQLAKQEKVDLFQRFAIMRDWSQGQHYPFGVFVSPDGLHMNDWGYACWAKLLAAAVGQAGTSPVASAEPQPAAK